MKGLIERLRMQAKLTKRYCPTAKIPTLEENAANAIEKLQAENNELFYTLEGVMHSVDKWLDDGDYSPNRVQRAATMREKTLQIVEHLQAELEQTKRERDAAVADIDCGCICVVCKHEKYCKMAQNPLCDEEEPCHFEWRGVQEESE